MHADYVPLHLHTEYSLLDGAIRIDGLIQKAIEYKIPAIAITDHGNLFGAIEFYERVSKAGLKPIIGCEVYVAPKSRFDRDPSQGNSEKSFHLILLCKDINGYRNLTRLITHSYLEGFYYKPRIDKDLLEQYSGGLVALSSCLKGEIPYLLSTGRFEEAREVALQYRRIFGAENFYLEIQANELPEQEEVNKLMIELSEELHIPIVASNDCHYLKREDATAHDVLLCIQTGKTLHDTDRMKFQKDTFYFKSPEEMKEYFRDIPEAVLNTRKIAERCNLDFEFDKCLLPKFQISDGEDPHHYLTKLAENGLRKKLGQNPPDNYVKRLKDELNMIEKMGFSSYFLIVWDFITFAKGRDIPVGPGRGSAAGSLVAYSLDITDIDPIKYGLLFERFLNPERVSMPDIDVDFCMDRRGEVIDYVTRKYGKDHVAQIITFGTMQARAAIRDVGRVMNIPYAEVDEVAKLVPLMGKVSIGGALEREPELRKKYESDPRIRELIDVAKSLEGIARHASTHAAGIVISPAPLTDYLPLYKAPNEETIVTQYDMDSIKKLGLLKFDFLGLKTLTIIDRCERIINKSREGKDRFSIKDIPLDDKKTFKLLSDARTTGIFQLESPGMRDLLRRLKPEAFEDLIALVALYRPGPIGSGMVDEFIENKNRASKSKNKKAIGSLAQLGLPKLNEIVKETHGIVLYQEQVMQIAHSMANFTLAQADILRKAMGGKNPEEMEKMKHLFINGLMANRVSREKAERLYNLILQFAQYGFNKSHSAAYALIAYQTAYLKAHYPVEFMAASLSADMDNTAKVVNFINECKDMGIKILPPDINESEREFTVIGNSIRFGLEAVKGVGGSAIDAILEAREYGRFESFLDFCSRIDTRRVNKKVIESLIKAGAFDGLGKRAQLLTALPSIMDSAMRIQRQRRAGQISMFDSFSKEDNIRLPEIEEFNELELLKMEKEAIGFYISGNPLDRYEESIRRLNVTPIDELQSLGDREDVIICGLIRDVKQIQTKKSGELMAYIVVEDRFGTVETIVFPDLYKEYRNMLISSETPVVISGYTDHTDRGLKVIAQKMVPIDRVDELKEPVKREATTLTNNHVEERVKSYRSLTLTLRKDLDRSKLTMLDKIFSKYTGDCPVYFRIVSPKEWETLLLINRSVRPSPELISEIEDLLGEKTAILS